VTGYYFFLVRTILFGYRILAASSLPKFKSDEIEVLFFDFGRRRIAPGSVGGNGRNAGIFRDLHGWSP